MARTPQTDPRIVVAMRRDRKRAIWRGIATSRPGPLDTTTSGERGFLRGRGLLPARFRR